MLSFVTWNVSPVAINLFGHEVRWYGLCWALGFLIGYYLVSRIFQKEKLPAEWVDKLFIYTILASIIGARLGHCFFYQWDYYSQHPLEILAIWEGGLASHGGVICLIAALIVYSRTVTKKSVWWLFDRMVPAIGICCGLIRLGNLMNSEIFGYPTTLPWGFYFVRSQEWRELYNGLPCHPTQIYEMLYCLAAAVIAWFMQRRPALMQRTGLITGVSLLIFFGTRFLLEFMKNPQVERELQMSLNIGQQLSIPFILLGLYLIITAWRNPHPKRWL
ncbi:MAG: prolipoprotein diacylglyceryl transferase [Bacteroidaceae bacterium]|jgi:phosphatidylglycerol:prolipoprotein diacylglycerol transferase